jgi:hypothetical protein
VTEPIFGIFLAALAEGASDDEAWRRTEAELDARAAARRSKRAAPVNVEERELAIRAMERQGTPRAEAERVLSNNPAITGAMREAISAERQLLQADADQAKAEAWAKSPDGIRAAGAAALAAKEAKARDAALARAYIEEKSAAAGVIFDATTLSDEEALQQAGLTKPTLSPQAQRVADQNAEYEADPLGAFTRSTLTDLTNRWPHLSTWQREQEVEGLAAIGIDTRGIAEQMPQGSGEDA